MPNTGWTQERPYFGNIYVEKPQPGNGRRGGFKHADPSPAAIREALRQLTGGLSWLQNDYFILGKDGVLKPNGQLNDLAAQIDKRMKAAKARAEFTIAEFEKLRAAAK